jgi:crotonobetainyl-CoA:carnitine CoA-transferase CaiB-like acyl-CoA transferase
MSQGERGPNAAQGAPLTAVQESRGSFLPLAARRAASPAPTTSPKEPGGSSLPLAGVRVLSFEQMQALPFATQLLARLGADVVKVERPAVGDTGRHAKPAAADPWGRPLGATFLRNNMGKRSIAIDVTTERGRELLLAMVPRFDVVAQNFRPGVVERLGLHYEAVRAVHPRVVYVSVSGFGTSNDSPYRHWPAYAPIVEAMSGITEMKRPPGDPPVVAPLGGVADIGAALFAVVGVLAALWDRQRTGEGQHIDVAMLDTTIALTDIVTNFWSMGLEDGRLGPQIMHGFRAADGWFVLMVAREEEFRRLCETIGRTDWLHDPRLASREGWVEHLESVIRPGIEAWAARRTRRSACEELARAGVAAAPCLRAQEVVEDLHVRARRLLAEIERVDGVEQPVLVPGLPVQMRGVAPGQERRPPWLGEHTDEVLATELGIGAKERAELRKAGVID